MASVSIARLVVLFIFIIFVVGAIILQIFLSKKENKWLGLILPLIFLILSFISVASIPAYTVTTGSVQTISENGDVIMQEITESTEKMPIGSLLLAVIGTFFITNIPTIILLAIYAACRKKTKRRLAMEKMKIQDLE
jgi:hypothetical protein